MLFLSYSLYSFTNIDRLEKNVNSIENQSDFRNTKSYFNDFNNIILIQIYKIMIGLIKKKYVYQTRVHSMLNVTFLCLQK